MDQAGSLKNHEIPRILVAPLDWGLGHATRCIPVIRELLARNCDVWLAGTGAQEELLKREFPGLPFLPLPGYGIEYARTKWGLAWKMLQQLPKMKRAIKAEHAWLKKQVADHQFDAIISDNRYGLYHDSVYSVIITHQLTIKSPAGKWTEKILQRINYSHINHFNECWVPDMQQEPNLAGELSHPAILPAIPVKYISPLSRFIKKQVPVRKNHLLILLSGPEPQRSLFEEKIIRDIAHYNHTATIVRGLPGTGSVIPSTNMIKFHNHLPADELNDVMLEADLVIGRTGYSSVMDIIVLQKRAVLVPTPGQTEQEYLGIYLQQKGLACCIDQNSFELVKAIKAAEDFNWQTQSLPFGLLEATIKELLQRISGGK